MLPLKIVSTGKALPSAKVTAEDIDAKFQYASGYAFGKGGVKVRHFAGPDETQSELASKALGDALQRAGLTLDDIDVLISACGIQEQALPSTASAIAKAAQLSPSTLCFDVGSSCLSFMAALRVAAGLFGPQCQRIAIVSADLASRGLDWEEPEASLIFGDGAACVIVEQGDGTSGIEAFQMETYVEGRDFCQIRAGGTLCTPSTGANRQDFLFRMDGRGVFKLASKMMPDFLSKLFGQAGLSIEDIAVVVPHQASHLGMSHLVKKLALPAERVINIYETHGNQVAASMPTALHEAFVTGRAAPGSRMLLVGTAAGLTLGGAILKL